jgi:hypothetical protein
MATIIALKQCKSLNITFQLKLLSVGHKSKIFPRSIDIILNRKAA